MSGWQWFLLFSGLLVWVYFASKIATFGTLQAIKQFLIKEHNKIQEKKAHGKKETKKHERQGKE